RHSLLDHLPDGARVFLDEPLELARALDEYVAETVTMRLEREARGDLPLGLPAAQANWPGIEAMLGRLAVVQLLRFGAEVVRDAPAGDADRQSRSKTDGKDSGGPSLDPHPNPLPSPGRANRNLAGRADEAAS